MGCCCDKCGGCDAKPKSADKKKATPAKKPVKK